MDGSPKTMSNERNQTQEVILSESIYMKFKNRQTVVTEMRMVTLGRRVVLTGKGFIMRGLLRCCSTPQSGWGFRACKHK